MVVRWTWYDSIAKAEASTRTELDRLLSCETVYPTDLIDFGGRVGARTEHAHWNEKRRGILCYSEGQWVVRVQGDPAMLSPRERFTVAHELAHLMLIIQGAPDPISQHEYWILESVCDRIARLLLVPIRQGPSGILKMDEIRRWFRDLVGTWKLTGENSARLICERSTNCLSSAFLQGHDTDASVVWSFRRGRYLDWPKSGTCVEGDLLTLKTILSQGQDSTARLAVSDGTLIGFNWTDKADASRSHSQLDLFDDAEGLNAPRRVLVAFGLSDFGSQPELPFDEAI